MATIDFYIANRTESRRISENAPSSETLPVHQLDPIDNVSFAKLLVLITGDDYKKVIGSFVRRTPAQVGVAPWDLENLLAEVIEIPRTYVIAVAELTNDRLLPLAKEWCRIEEFKWWKPKSAEMIETLKGIRRFARRCLKSRKQLLMRLAT